MQIGLVSDALAFRGVEFRFRSGGKYDWGVLIF